jgi:hypothetical protein
MIRQGRNQQAAPPAQLRGEVRQNRDYWGSKIKNPETGATSSSGSGAISPARRPSAIQQ